MKKTLTVILILILVLLAAFVGLRVVQAMSAVDAGEAQGAPAEAAAGNLEQPSAQQPEASPDAEPAAGDNASDASEASGEAAEIVTGVPDQHASDPAAGTANTGSDPSPNAEAPAAKPRDYDLNFTVGGQPLSADTETLDLTLASSEEIDRLIEVLPALTKLQTLELGSAAAESPAISWEQVRALREGAPNTVLNYRFTVQGYSFTLADEILNLNHITFTDEGELAGKIAVCMPNLTLLDMDSCGVSNESMAAIRDSLPDSVTVAWRIWFGGYTIRTDEVRVLASNPDRGGDLTEEEVKGLYYCTKVKYLDLGHNDKLTSIEFVRNMPDLEVLIISMTGVKDISPLVDCPKLNFLEWFSSAAFDLTPLQSLPLLKDLHLCNSYALRDIRPLYDIDLDRLWLGDQNPIPYEQIEEYRRLHPNCQIYDGRTEDPIETEWRTQKDYYPPRAAPRYAQLWEEFQYGREFQAYAYVGNDTRENARFEYY